MSTESEQYEPTTPRRRRRLVPHWSMVRGKLSDLYAQSEPGSMVAVGSAVLSAASKLRGEGKHEKGQRAELIGKTLIATGLYTFGRALFAAAEEHGMREGIRIGEKGARHEAAVTEFDRGRLAGWREAGAWWRLDVPTAVEHWFTDHRSIADPPLSELDCGAVQRGIEDLIREQEQCPLWRIKTGNEGQAVNDDPDGAELPAPPDHSQTT